MKLIILDRDGVINHDRDDYIKSADECIAIAGSIEAIVRLYKAGYTVVVATNQSGLARGKFDLDDLEAIHAKITALIEEQGGELGGIFYCPHQPEDECRCRKPLPGLLDAIEAEFNTSVEGCYFVGDSLRDLQAGAAKACRPVLVKTGNGLKALQQLSDSSASIKLDNVIVCEDLAAVVDLILISDN
jgi:D-glycero-D-manno-heptose 1,7-bisphosphate phosphatase